MANVPAGESFCELEAIKEEIEDLNWDAETEKDESDGIELKMKGLISERERERELVIIK